MTVNLLSETWSSWRGTTKLHGPNEYGSMRGVVAKAAWTLVLVAVACFFIWQVSNLCHSYVNHRKQTTVKFIAAALLPKIAILHWDLSGWVEDDLFRELAAIDAYVGQGERVLAKMAHGGMNICPLESYWQAMNSQPLQDMNQAPEVNLTWINELAKKFTEFYTSEVFPNILLIPRGHQDSEFMQKIRRRIRDGENLAQEDLAAANKTWQEFEVDVAKISSARITAAGPKLLFNIRTETVKSLDAVVFFVTRGGKSLAGKAYYELPPELGLYFGRSAEEFGFSNSLKLPLPSHPYAVYWHLSARFSMHERAKFYCNPEYDKSMLDCLEMCMVDKARADPENGCVPYLGDAPYASGIPICSLKANGSETCAKAREECDIMCENCETCQPCSEVKAQVTVLWHTVVAVNSSTPTSAIVINISEEDGVRLYKTSEYYGSADFFSQVGGLLGLCCGASVLTIVHMMYFCCATAPKIPKVLISHEEQEPESEIKSFRREILKIVP